MQNAAQNSEFHAAEQQFRQLEEIKIQLKAAMSQILSKEAMQRLMILRGTKPEFALQAELAILELYKARQLKAPVSDVQFKEILTQFSQPKNKTKIKRA